MSRHLIDFVLKRPAWVFRLTIITLLAVVMAVGSPFVTEQSPFPKLTIDTDPENMLRADEPARVLNAALTDRFNLHDAVVIAVEDAETEVFTPSVLADVASLASFAATLDGVIADDIVAPSTIDVAIAGGFEPLVSEVPATQTDALAVRDRMLADPLLNGTVVATDGGAIAIAVPIESKADGYRVTTALQGHIETLGTGVHYHVTGLPVAQSVFGVEMFIQMAIAAPAAMALIYVLLFLIFRSWWAASVPLAIAMVSSLGAMGALILTGNTVHIMSSMIPIFVMPIAVMDAIHVLSEFADKHTRDADRKSTIRSSIRALWQPMLFTTVTTMAGFASLALAPIPPVQIFGLFVAFGVFLAWAATMVIVPAALVRLPEAAIDRIVAANSAAGTHWLSRLALGRPRLVLLIVGVVAVALFSGLDRIQINDTPMRWFAASHPVRVAESVLTERFAGAHPAYLAISGDAGTFERPEMLSYIASLGDHLEQSANVGATIALPDLLASAHHAGGGADGELPDTAEGVTRLLDGFANAGKGDALRPFVSADRSEAVIHLQMPTGDNLTMRAVEAMAADAMASTPPPEQVQATWFGLTYLNAVWQDQMVSGMLDALVGSFIAVFVLLVLLFRSVLWAVVAVLPLTFAIGGTYGAIGWLGRDFDMPIAVLSTLSLGLAVDFAIHFVSRLRQADGATMADRLAHVYREPARAIQRNAIVLGLGFLPLLASPLIPYRTVGMLIPTIIIISAIATVVLLGAILSAGRRQAPTPSAPRVIAG